MFLADLTYSYTLYTLAPIALVVTSFIYISRNGMDTIPSCVKPLIIYLYMAYFLSIALGGYQTTAQYLTFFAPILVYSVSNIAVRTSVDEKYLLLFLIMLFLSLAFYYFTNLGKNLILDFEYQDNAAYTLLYFLPAILCIKKNVFKIIGIVIILIAMLFSMKRGGLIAFALAI